ncbi:MAG: hypothetical protein IT210_07460 [Armatimonadetes bacterium]|nr:hypothetical protein [Armatimonadota bacterium]
MSQENSDIKHPGQPEVEALVTEPVDSHEFGTAWIGGWTAPIIVTLFTLIWLLGQYLLIPERPRDWQYSTVYYVPAQSVVSTRHFSPKAAHGPQVEYPSTTRRLTDGQ